MRKINRPWPKSNQFWSWSGYISMPNFWPLLPQVLKVMPRNPKFDQFYWAKVVQKWRKSTDRDQNLIRSEVVRIHQMQNLRPLPPCILKKMPGNLKFDQLHQDKVVPESRKSIDRNQNLISSEGGGDTSACLGHSRVVHRYSVYRKTGTT